MPERRGDRVGNSSYERPLVTFALFAFNQQPFVRAAIEGAFSQTYGPLEIILSDDFSKDQTFGIMQEMAAAYTGPHAVRIRRNESNLGFAAHINAVLAEARGEIICWAAGDDISLPERVARLSEPMLRDASVVATHSSVTEIDLEGKVVGGRSHPRLRGDLTHLDVIEGWQGVVSQAHAFRRVVFDHFGPFQDALSNDGPVMAFREISLGKVVYIPEPTVLYRVGSGVSTYSGDDWRKLKYDEPRKISLWHVTALRQMLADLDKIPEHPHLGEKIVAELGYWEEILSINARKKPVLHALYRLLKRGRLDSKAVRAGLRVIIPDNIYRLYVQMRRR